MLHISSVLIYAFSEVTMFSNQLFLDNFAASLWSIVCETLWSFPKSPQTQNQHQILCKFVQRRGRCREAWNDQLLETCGGVCDFSKLWQWQRDLCSSHLDSNQADAIPNRCPETEYLRRDRSSDDGGLPIMDWLSSSKLKSNVSEKEIIEDLGSKILGLFDYQNP